MIAIVIEPAFWQTEWFKVAGTLFIIAAAVVLALARIRSIRKKGEMERSLVTYQLRALRAQMNPHFIFNSLNSILHFMVKHDLDGAHDYLKKFSTLMRATLDNSRSETVTLADEIEALRLYLDLEKLRLDDAFSYRITIEPGIDLEELEIPPLIIQPYVENAIQHGLAHKKEKGRLEVGIWRGEHGIICSVVDNGIGRRQAMAGEQGKRQGHKSSGMDITRARLDVMSLLDKIRYGTTVVDLYDNEQRPAGTRVDIYIPTIR